MNFQSESPDDALVFSWGVSEIYRFLDQVCRMEADTFDAPWKKQDFIHELESADSRCMVIYQSGILCGYLFAKAVCDEISINKICIHESMRGHGFGKFLLQRFLEKSKSEFIRIFLEVDSTNTPAVRLYTGFGFQTIRTRKAIYENGADGFEMVLKL